MKNRVLADPIMTSQEGAKKEIRTFFAMGTMMSLTAYGEHAPVALAAAAARIAELDFLLARMNPDSEIARLNTAAQEHWVKVRDDTDAVLREALRYAEKTGGAYDPAIGRLVDLWRIKNRRPGDDIPPAGQIRQALLACDYRKIERDHAGQYRLPEGASLDLGGIAKGYAADQVYALFRQQAISSALISLGTSSVAALGVKPDASPWKVGLKDVDGQGSAYFGIVFLQDQFLSTSGDYEQYFMKNGRRYHHILDKSTGYPADNGLRSVTVVAGNGALSEAYSTALLVMGLDRALAFQKSAGGFEAVLVTADKRIVCTAGLQNSFKFKGQWLGYQYEEKHYTRRRRLL